MIRQSAVAVLLKTKAPVVLKVLPLGVRKETVAVVLVGVATQKVDMILKAEDVSKASANADLATGAAVDLRRADELKAIAFVSLKPFASVDPKAVPMMSVTVVLRLVVEVFQKVPVFVVRNALVRIGSLANRV